MGYFVTSVLAVGPDDRHQSFIYFVPSRRLKYEWINDWVYSRFTRLASSLGPTAVVIAPPPEDRTDGFEASFGEAARSFRPLTRGDAPLHAGFPFFVVSRRPIGVDGESQVPCGAMNLALLSEEELATLVDRLVEGARAGVDLVECAPEIAGDLSEEDEDWPWALERAVQIKPSVFGIGLDVNHIVELLGRWRQKRARERDIASTPLAQGGDSKLPSS